MQKIFIVRINVKQTLYFPIGQNINIITSGFRQLEFSADIDVYKLVVIEPVDKRPDTSDITLYGYRIIQAFGKLEIIIPARLNGKRRYITLRAGELRKQTQLNRVIINRLF